MPRPTCSLALRSPLSTAADWVAQISRAVGAGPAGLVALLQGTRSIGHSRLDFSTRHTRTDARQPGAANTEEPTFHRDDRVAVHAELVQGAQGNARLTRSTTESLLRGPPAQQRDGSEGPARSTHWRDKKIKVQSHYTTSQPIWLLAVPLAPCPAKSAWRRSPAPVLQPSTGCATPKTRSCANADEPERRLFIPAAHDCACGRQ